MQFRHFPRCNTVNKTSILCVFVIMNESLLMEPINMNGICVVLLGCIRNYNQRTMQPTPSLTRVHFITLSRDNL